MIPGLLLGCIVISEFWGEVSVPIVPDRHAVIDVDSMEYSLICFAKGRILHRLLPRYILLLLMNGRPRLNQLSLLYRKATPHLQ
jgi:hypothetical protein